MTVMKRISILLLAALSLLACRQAEDTRFFAPELSFGVDSYTAASEDGGADVVINLSRPAPMAFQIGLIFSGGLQEGVQFTVPSHTIDVPKGAEQARIHITLVDDEIWDEHSYIDIQLTPGNRYTVNPNNNCEVRVNVTKSVALPVLRLNVDAGEQEINPFRPVPVTLHLSADKAPVSDLHIDLNADGLAPGTDFLIDGAPAAAMVLPAGATSASAELQIVQKDQSGYDAMLTLSMTSQPGQYGVASDAANVSIRLYDPLPDFKQLWRTAAQVGDGYQFRQAILGADGETWNGNLAANMMLQADGSAYLKSLRNMSSGTFGCMSNDVGLHILRLTEFLPNLRTTSGDAIVDYGNNNNTRGFSPVDSLFRFVLDKGSVTEGDLVLSSPRTFTAFTGDYRNWQDNWKSDSNETGGNIFASKSSIITGRVDVKLVKMEGRFNLSDLNNTLLFTAWFSCDHPQFMKDVDLSTLGAVQEDGLWKVQYKIWPR